MQVGSRLGGGVLMTWILVLRVHIAMRCFKNPPPPPVALSLIAGEADRRCGLFFCRGLGLLFS